VRRVSFYQSTLGKKAVVAVTGAILIGYLVAHTAGNLKVFLPDPEPGVRDIDVAFLRSAGEPILPHNGALWDVGDVTLRWNACVRMIERHPRCAPDPEERAELGIE